MTTALAERRGRQLRCELVRLDGGRRGRSAAEPDREACCCPICRSSCCCASIPERWEPLVAACWPFATRVVVDSTGERSGLHSLPGLLAREPPRSVTDLSWTKLTGWRELVARLFDPPKAARALQPASTASK